MYELQAYSGRYIWAFPDHLGQPNLGPHLLPDGIDVGDAVANGDTSRLGFVPRFRRSGGGPQIGDLVWTGTNMKIASQRFVDVLESVHATGYRTFTIDLIDGRRRPISGFVGFAVDLEAPPAADVRPNYRWQSFRFLITDSSWTPSARRTPLDTATPRHSEPQPPSQLHPSLESSPPVTG